MKTRFLSLLAILIFLSLSVVTANAITIYGNSAGNSNPVHIIDSTTGIETTRYTRNPNGNGRGMVVVGNTIYYTNTSDPRIYKMDLNTGITTGSILTTNLSMSTIAWDGSTFWTTDYAGTNKAFQIDPITGNNIKTITLGNATSFMDGMEYFNGKLIANRVDAGFNYDIYDLDGKLLTANFIDTGNTRTTGIAFDGTDFWVSNIFDSSISRYDGTTGALIETVNLTSTNGSFLIEDLSVDYAQRQDTGGGGNTVPEPGTMVLLGFGLLAMAGSQRKKSN